MTKKAAAKHLSLTAKPLLSELKQSLKDLEDWNTASIHAAIVEIVERKEVGFGAIAQPVRVALTGNTVSPGIDITIDLIGREKVLQRLDAAIQWIECH